MKLIFTLLLSILVIDKSISTNNLCIKVQNKCEGSYDSQHKYEIKCQKNPCHGKLSFECGSNYCAQNKHSCDITLNMIFLLNLYKRFHFYDKEMKKITNSIKTIKNCSVDGYSLQSDDICINGDGCLLISRFPFRFGMNRATKLITCPCPVGHSYSCGERFCAVHSDACSAFNKTGFSSINKNCGNSESFLNNFNLKKVFLN